MYYTDLEYDEYDDYVKSAEWTEIRDIKYNSGDPYRCRLCHARKQLILHKRTYYSLHPAFFRTLLQKNKKIFRMILVYLCPKCNTLVHYYDGKKKKRKVELDYVFLWTREQQIYWRVDRVFLRNVRSFARLFESFWIPYGAPKRKLNY